MMHSIMIFGVGDVGTRIAEALLNRGNVRELILVDLPGKVGEASAEMLSSCYLVPIIFKGINALDPAEVEQVVKRYQPDLIVQTASLRSPFAVMMADHPVAHALHKAGMAVQFGYQFPLVHSIMQGVRTVAPDTPVANVSYPDLAHSILNSHGLAPTAGLANTGIIQMRIETNLLREKLPNKSDAINVPQVRVIGGHAHVYGVLFGEKPKNGKDEPWVYLGDSAQRADDILYSGANLLHCPNLNMLTCAASLPVLEALLPNGADCFTSMPGPLGMLGGYPVKISQAKIELDMPENISLSDAQSMNIDSMRIDGIESVECDGTIHYTEAAQQAMAEIEPRLTTPYNPITDKDRTSILLNLVDSIN